MLRRWLHTVLAVFGRGLILSIVHVTIVATNVADNVLIVLLFWTLSYHVKLLASVGSGIPYPLLHQQTHLNVLE